MIYAIFIPDNAREKGEPDAPRVPTGEPILHRAFIDEAPAVGESVEVNAGEIRRVMDRHWDFTQEGRRQVAGLTLDQAHCRAVVTFALGPVQ